LTVTGSQSIACVCVAIAMKALIVIVSARILECLTD
jgi:hypothetical protein